MTIAQGKATEAAAVGNAHPTSSLPFFLVCHAGWRAGAANPEKRAQFILHA